MSRPRLIKAYLAGLRQVPASAAGALPLIPVFGVTAGYVIGERLAARQWAGPVLVVAAVLVVAGLQTRPQRDPAPVPGQVGG